MNLWKLLHKKAIMPFRICFEMRLFIHHCNDCLWSGWSESPLCGFLICQHQRDVWLVAIEKLYYLSEILAVIYFESKGQYLFKFFFFASNFTASNTFEAFPAKKVMEDFFLE